MNRWTRSLTKGASNALNPGETILVEQDGVRIDDGDNKVVKIEVEQGEQGINASFKNCIVPDKLF